MQGNTIKDSLTSLFTTQVGKDFNTQPKQTEYSKFATKRDPNLQVANMSMHPKNKSGYRYMIRMNMNANSQDQGNSKFDPSKLPKNQPLDVNNSYSDTSQNMNVQSSQRMLRNGEPKMTEISNGKPGEVPRNDPMLDQAKLQSFKAAAGSTTLVAQESPLKNQDKDGPAPGFYAWFVLILVTMIRTAYVINKNSIGYAFGFQGVGEMATSKFMLSKSYPQIVPIYGIVASLLFSAAYSTSNIFMSAKSKKWNKKWMLALGTLGFGMSSLIAGGINSFWVFCVMRFTFGLCSSAINAPIYQLIATNFPPKFRATANAVENSGYCFGCGVSSLMILILKNYGWRAVYYFMGTFGVTLGLLTVAFVKNPKVQQAQEEMKALNESSTLSDDEEPVEKKSVIQEFKSAISDLWTNPTAKWVTLGGAFRFFEIFTLVYFLPCFYQRVFPDYKSEFAILNGLIQGFLGFISTLGSGILGDRLEKKSRMSKAYIGIFGSLVSIPIMAGCCLFQGVPFYTSLFFLGLRFLLSEGFMAPTITMMQATCKPEAQGSIVSAYLFFLTVSGCLSTIILNQLCNFFGAAASPHIYGKLIFAGSLFGYLGSIPSFWKAGKNYIKFQDEQKRKNKEDQLMAQA